MDDRNVPRIKLIGPAMAPPVELQRWLLQSRSIPFEYKRRAAGLHAFASRRHKMPIELPLILTPEGPVGGLLPSLNWFDRIASGRGRLFRDEATHDFIAGLCGTLFGAAVKTFYFNMLRVPRVLVPAAIALTPRRDRLFVRLLQPVWIWMMRLGLGLKYYDPSAAEAAIDGAFSLVEARLKESGGPFLGGAEPSDEDIVFAVLASPVILPKGHPAVLPADEALPPAFRALVERFRARPAGALAQRVYEGRPAVG